MEQLLVLGRHSELVNLLSGAKGGTSGIKDIEIRHLAWLASRAPIGGSIVEVGSNRGKSICAMGTACKDAGNLSVRIFAVDLWTKGRGITYEGYETEETWSIFKKQVAQMGLSDMIRPVMSSSLDAASKRRKPIHLLFIDACHKYPDVLADYTVWHKFISHGGRIAFHDYGTRFKGVDRVVDEVVKPSGLWKDYHVYGRIWSATRNDTKEV